jgi:hypothetical protein
MSDLFGCSIRYQIRISKVEGKELSGLGGSNAGAVGTVPRGYAGLFAFLVIQNFLDREIGLI